MSPPASCTPPYSPLKVALKVARWSVVFLEMVFTDLPPMAHTSSSLADSLTDGLRVLLIVNTETQLRWRETYDMLAN